MLKIKSRLTTKILLFVLITSFILIGGSFTFFYYSGKSYITSNSIKELQNYSERFNQSLQIKINRYSNIITSILLNQNNGKNNYKSLLKNIENTLNNNSKKIEKIYLQFEEPSKPIEIYPVTVLGGKQVINNNVITKNQFDSLYTSLKITTKSSNGAEFGYLTQELFPDFYIRKKNEYFKIIIKPVKLFFLEEVLKDIYFTKEINFSIIAPNDVIVYSTNKFWINQSALKYFKGNKINKNSFSDDENKIIYSIWLSDKLNSKILISQNVSQAYNKFSKLLNNILLYSIFIYLLIAVFTIIFANKLSHSLNKITAVAEQVAEGRFDNQIEIKRSDELGLLISSFNNMIVELKSSYNKLNLTNKELQEKLNELTQTRIELSKKQKLALVGETVSKISHEIQNKISGVSVWVQNLEIQTSGDENISLFVNEIKDALTSFMQMLQNFKKFYRKPFLEIHNTDLIKILERVIKKYKPDVDKKKITLETTSIAEKIPVKLDEKLFEEVIENLLTNSIYFSPENSIISMEIKGNNEKIFFTICDEGPGIKKENHDNIFHPFFTTKSSGSGLGLAIVKNIIEAHGGTIELINKEKKGTCFKITIMKNI